MTRGLTDTALAAAFIAAAVAVALLTYKLGSTFGARLPQPPTPTPPLALTLTTETPREEARRLFTPHPYDHNRFTSYTPVKQKADPMKFDLSPAQRVALRDLRRRYVKVAIETIDISPREPIWVSVYGGWGWESRYIHPDGRIARSPRHDLAAY